MTKTKSMFTKLVMYKEGVNNPIFDDMSTTISIEDEGGGMFIVLEQYYDDRVQELRIDVDEIPELIKNLEYMAMIIKQNEKSNDPAF